LACWFSVSKIKKLTSFYEGFSQKTTAKSKGVLEQFLQRNSKGFVWVTYSNRLFAESVEKLGILKGRGDIFNSFDSEHERIN